MSSIHDYFKKFLGENLCHVKGPCVVGVLTQDACGDSHYNAMYRLERCEGLRFDIRLITENTMVFHYPDKVIMIRRLKESDHA